MEYVINTMDLETLTMAVDWADKEGWNPGINDANCYFKADPNGFYVGRLNNEIISFGSAVCYDDHFAFCGFYMVKPEYRGQGYGLQLTHHRLNYVGDRITGIDGVLNNVEIYKRIGYVYAHKNFRFQINALPLPTANSLIKPLSDIPKTTLYDYDRLCFPANRHALLNCWVSGEDRVALGYYDNNQLKGYGVIRPASEGYRIGPLFADNNTIAQEILLHLAKAVGQYPIYIDMPETNIEAMTMAKKFKLKEIFATARMYRNGTPELDISKVFAISNFELG